MFLTNAGSSGRFSVLWVLAALGAGGLMAQTSYDTFGGGLVVTLACLLVTLLFVTKGVPRSDRHFMSQLLAVALVAKVAATYARWHISFNVYHGQDAARYDGVGRVIAESIRDGNWAEATLNFQWGTPFVEFFTGLVYVAVGPTLYGGFLVFSFLAFLGSLFFYKAFRTAFPDAKWRVYATLVFLFPSILYWPTGLGKDALMFFAAGLSAYGTALILRDRLAGALPLLLGLFGALLVRPHVAAVLVLAMAVAFFLRKPSVSQSASTMGWLLGLVVSVGATGLLVVQGASFLGLDSLSPTAALDFLSVQGANVFEGEGGSSNFSTTLPSNPMWVPMSLVTVLIRPFPWEAHNFQILLQSLESLMLAGLLLLGSKRILRAFTRLGRDPYLLYILCFTLIIVLALGTLGNFGLLARQRSVVLPFVLMLTALAPGTPPPDERELKTTEMLS